MVAQARPHQRVCPRFEHRHVEEANYVSIREALDTLAIQGRPCAARPGASQKRAALPTIASGLASRAARSMLTLPASKFRIPGPESLSL
jgi:hypothetical protein